MDSASRPDLGPSWIEGAMIYHLYPLGTCGAPWRHDGGPAVPRIRELLDWIEPASRIGANTVLLGPIWQSASHGYDTTDYRALDRRLGTNGDLAEVIAAWKARGFRVVLDAVLNHCGRDFFAFADLREKDRDSAYAGWFSGVDFSRRSPCGDSFNYEGWNGHHSLPKFDLSNPEVRRHHFDAIDSWVRGFGIDGLRLDAADVMDKDFLRALSGHCRAQWPGLWLMGEVIHGDYREWAPGAGLDSVTNYELFKGLWSSLNDGNYHEAAWSLGRQFGSEGMYRGMLFSSFGDNHDVERVASRLGKTAWLYPHAILQATAPGIPTIYYGSEAGLKGRKEDGDEALRPALAPAGLDSLPEQPLRQLWRRLAEIRAAEPSLRTGDYREALVAPRQFAFWRYGARGARPVLVALNSADAPAAIRVPLPQDAFRGRWIDLLNPGLSWDARSGTLSGTLDPCWGRILVPA